MYVFYKGHAERILQIKKANDEKEITASIKLTANIQTKRKDRKKKDKPSHKERKSETETETGRRTERPRDRGVSVHDQGRREVKALGTGFPTRMVYLKHDICDPLPRNES